jgi:hypothetical protein
MTDNFGIILQVEWGDNRTLAAIQYKKPASEILVMKETFSSICK